MTLCLFVCQLLYFFFNYDVMIDTSQVSYRYIKLFFPAPYIFLDFLGFVFPCFSHFTNLHNHNILCLSLPCFKGWRAVWVSYNEALTDSRRNIDTMKITAPTTSSTIHAFYFDLIRLVKRLRRQSRDTIVPTITPLYTPNNFWQQTYRWSQVSC